MSGRKVEIAGGGIAGLSLAWSLALHGWRVRVYERQNEIREIGAGILLMRNSRIIFERHGIDDLVLAGAIPLIASERLDHQGRSIQRQEFPREERWLCIARPALVRGLAEAATRAGAEIVTESEAVSADPDGSIVFKDGRKTKADLIVAADGFRSRLREHLGLTAYSRERATGATRLLIPRGEAERVGQMMEYWSGKRRVGVVACSTDQTYIYLSCPNDDEDGRAIPLRIESWQAAFPCLISLFERARSARNVVRHSYAYGAARSWSRGRVAIVGDAAHAFPPTLGQGAGLAIANGYALARELDKTSDVLAGLKAWEEKYRHVSDQTQVWSARIDALTARWPRYLDHVRRILIWSIGHSEWLNRRVRIADRLTVEGPGAS